MEIELTEPLDPEEVVARLAPELRWGLAFGQLPRNTRTVTAAALARARLVWFRRRHRTA